MRSATTLRDLKITRLMRSSGKQVASSSLHIRKILYLVSSFAIGGQTALKKQRLGVHANTAKRRELSGLGVLIKYLTQY